MTESSERGQQVPTDSVIDPQATDHDVEQTTAAGDVPVPSTDGAAPSAAAVTQPATAESSGSSPAVQVFRPNNSEPAATPSEYPSDDFFEPGIADVQRYQATIAGRSQQLNDAPLLTSKFRDAEQAAKDKAKATKWPTATIRIKFSDGTQIQSTFPSSSPIQPVYDFVRSSLSAEATSKPFTLTEPPNIHFPEHPIPQIAKKHINPKMKAHIITPSNYGPVKGASTRGGTGGKESLSDLGLVPQSVLLVKWEDVAWNSSGFVAPIRDELRAQAAPLPPSLPKEGGDAQGQGQAPRKKLTGSAGDVKMPKWLAKGLMKKK